MHYQLKNLAIAASAGAGKTFQLVHRFIGLLALGVEPERISALTFSRKAAGEMFDRVIQELAAAATSEPAARQLQKQLRECDAIPPELKLDQDEACRLLRRLLDKTHRTRIGTLDSFLVSVIQAFPFEFGMGGEFDILEGYPASVARQETMRRVLLLQGGADTPASQGFLDGFKQATYGQEIKKFSDVLNQFIEEYHALLLEAHSPQLWGTPERIWPESGCHWLAKKDFPPKAAAAFQDFLEQYEIPARQVENCQQFFDALPAFHPVADWNKVKYLFCKLRDIYSDLRRGNGTLSLNRKKIELTPEACRNAARLVKYIIAQFIAAHIERTRGLYKVLNTYETTYRQWIRQTGRLSFNDVAFLLNSHRLADPEGGTPPLSTHLGAPDRLYVDYRLDSHFDHWLLDEFQDTSTLQWHAIENLIDEVLQDQSGQRSFFYVGDVKQAIYGWRGGDPELFEYVQRKYGGAPDNAVIQRRSLAQSWRSSPPLIDTVNAVFNNLRAHDLPIDTRVWDRWETSWEKHKTAKVEEPGFAGLYSLPRQKGESNSEREKARFRVALEILRTIRPIERNLTAAALVRTNEQGRRLADFLRREDIPVLYAGSFSILDNPVTAAFVSLIKLAEHPGDTYSWQHLRMTPLIDNGTDHSKSPPPEFIAKQLDSIGKHGFEFFLKSWLARIDNDAMTDFEKRRLRDLLNAAREFDATGNRCTTDFLQFLEEYAVEDTGSADAIQIMTVHKAKGLQFDMVVLPALDRKNGIDSVDASGLHVEKAESTDRQPRWVLDMPRKDITQADKVLSATLDRMKVDAAYEELCNLYVAMTRAKHGLYMITTKPGKTSQSVYPSTVLTAGLKNTSPEKDTSSAQTVSCIYTAGNSDWYKKAQKPASSQTDQAAHPLRIEPQTFYNRQRYRRGIPSGDEETVMHANLFFKPGAKDFADFGKALHAFMSYIKWYGPGLDLPSIYDHALQLLDVSAEVAEDAFKQMKHALSFPTVQKALSRTGTAKQMVWLEKRFELILNNTWISGCFDRVVIEYNRDDAPVAAEIIDYKTSIIGNQQDLIKKSQSYANQLQIYRQALARMIDLPEEKIRTLLIFTRTGNVVELPQKAQKKINPLI